MSSGFLSSGYLTLGTKCAARLQPGFRSSFMAGVVLSELLY